MAGNNKGGRRAVVWRLAMWGGAAALLLTPLVAMQFTDEVDWSVADFVVVGGMLMAACGAFEVGARLSGNLAYRAGVGVAIVAAFLLIWINLAVGIIGNEDNPANQMYAGVLVVGFGGAIIASFKPRGMARTMAVAAVAQVLVAVIAVAAGMGVAPVPLTGFFAALWVLSAWLFGKAARDAAFPAAV
jgi:hypothetical protein